LAAVCQIADFDPLLFGNEIPKYSVLPKVVKEHCEEIR